MNFIFFWLNSQEFACFIFQTTSKWLHLFVKINTAHSPKKRYLPKKFPYLQAHI